MQKPMECKNLNFSFNFYFNIKFNIHNKHCWLFVKINIIYKNSNYFFIFIDNKRTKIFWLGKILSLHNISIFTIIHNSIFNLVA